jgi:ABC-2 type transport system permease protein
LLIRGYISEKSHPLLNPLRPRIEDLLREYAVAGHGKVTAEVVDPAKNPDLEAEANQTYNIQPVPFQVADRYQNSIVSSYFDILVRYGDQNVVLNFRDLIQVTPNRDGTVDVQLRNLEYDLTSAIKKVVFGFQSVEAVLAAIKDPVELTLIQTPDLLPKEVKDAPKNIEKVAKEIADKSDGKFTFKEINPDDPKSGVTRQQLRDQYKLQDVPVSLFSDQGFYLHMLLKSGQNTQVLYPTADVSEGAVRSAIENALKRSTSGFLKIVGLWTPPETPTQDMFGQQQQPLSTWQQIRQHLGQEYTVQAVDLSSGQPPSNIDTLLVIMPQNLSDKELFAIDQFLMRGGSLIVAAGNYAPSVDPMAGSLAMKPVEKGLRDLLLNYGVDVQQAMVMDDQNQPFPVPVTRNVGGVQVQQFQAINFPFFVDVRPDGMERGQAIVAGLPAATLNWVSPVVLDPAKNKDRQTTVLMHSSKNSWLRTNPDIQPNFDQYPDRGYAVEGEMKSYPLAVVAQGVFPSFFKDKPSPLTAQPTPEANNGQQAQPTPAPLNISTITESPATARLVVIGTGEFLDDFAIRLSSQIVQDRVLNNLQLAQNAVDWSVEDTDLLSIRSRGTFTRLLDHLTETEQRTWEIGNYIAALIALLLVGGIWYLFRRSERPMKLTPPSDGTIVSVPATGD